MDSIWTKDAPRVSFNALESSIKTDVLIIGGGIAGILCAYKLKNAGVSCVLAEADEICGGITKNTTAKITITHGLIYNKLIKRFGEDGARLYLDAQLNACKEYARLCGKIDCDYEKRDSFVYSLTERDKLKKEADALNSLGVNASLTDTDEIPVKNAGAVCVKGQAQFHPLKFLYEISKELHIYEHTKVTELLPDRAVTKNGDIFFKKLIVATHFPMLNKHGAFFLKLYQHRSYVIALKGAKDVRGMYVDEADTGLSFRGYGELLLLGGGGHRTGKKGGCWQELEAFAKEHYKGAEVVGKWATQDCISLDRVPYIGQYSRHTPGVYVATGFNKWGMTGAMVSANLLCSLITGKSTPEAAFFSPQRSVLRPQLAVNAFESALGLITPTVPRCPHLGCALKYNRQEHSWDCPCHGSRFTENGELIDGPATDDKKL